MHKIPSKKKHITRLVVVYTIMSVAVVLLVTSLIFVMLGYQFNRKDGKIEQGGLVQFDSRPGSATIMIDGSQLGSSTATKATLSVGKHTIEYSRNGYQTWKKDINVKPSSVSWLTYARLVPSKLTPERLAAFDTLDSSLAAPNNKLIAVIPNKASAELQIIDTEPDAPRTSKLVLPDELYTNPTEEPKNHNFHIDAWDGDSRYILVSHHYGADSLEWLIVDTRDVANGSKNITKLLDINAQNVQFSMGDGHILYAIVDGSVRKINLNDATLSRPLIPNVADYSQYDRSTIVYTTEPVSGSQLRTAGYYTDNAKTTRTVRSYADDGGAALRFRIAQYYGDRYYAIQHGEIIDIFKGDLPSSDSKNVVEYTPVVSMTIPGGADYLTFSPTGRFVLMQKGASFTTYDLETKQSTNKTIDGAGDVSKLVWLDGYYLATDRDGKLTGYEFDGLNPRTYMPATPGQAFMISSNNRYLYGFSTGSDNKQHLQRVKLIL